MFLAVSNIWFNLLSFWNVKKSPPSKLFLFKTLVLQCSTHCWLHITLLRSDDISLVAFIHSTYDGLKQFLPVSCHLERQSCLYPGNQCWHTELAAGVCPGTHLPRGRANPPEAVTHLTLQKPMHLSATFPREAWRGCPGTGLLWGYRELCNNTPTQKKHKQKNIQRGKEAEEQQGEDMVTCM